MFGLIRTPILILIAFVGGMMFERNQAGELCAELGGTTERGICKGVTP